MLASTAQLITAVGGVAFLMSVGLYRYHNESGLFGALSFVAWAFLAFGADSITTMSNGAAVTRAQPTLQYLSFALALVSALAIAGAVSGKWPQETDP